VQSHTVTHSNLVNLTPDQLNAELQNSQQMLATTFGGPIGDLAAPYGTQNTDTVNAVSALYQSQRTTDSGYNSRDYLDPYRLRVKTVRSSTTPADVQGWLNTAAAERTWLILVYHQVDTDPAVLCSTCYGVTPANFDTEMAAVSASGLAKLTLSQALHEAAPQAGVQLNAVAPASNELIVNPGLEQPSPGGTSPANWQQGYWGDNTHTFTWATDGHTGSRSVRVDIGSWTNGQAKWYYPAVAVQGGKRYQFSDWYKSNASSTVSVAYTMRDGTIHYDGQDFAIPPASTWTRYAIGVVLPPGATSAFFSHAIGGAGYLPQNSYLQTDDYSMTLSTSAAGFTRGLVSLTFDDGSQSIYDALPAVEAHGWKTTQYIPTEGINQWVWSESRIRDVYARGHEIAAHTVSHPYLTTLTDSQLAAELRNSKSTLERITGAPVVSFSSPYGDYDARVVQAIKDAGYTNHRSVDVGYGTKYDLTPWNIHVENMMATTTMAEFNSWVDEAAANNYYLVIVYHEVMNGSTGDPGLDQYSTTPELFGQQLASIAASGLTVKTVKDAMAELSGQLVAAP
jgi:peptidoglycan/xylan/chitin deacetylase (PgdA/CDA1 family)